MKNLMMIVATLVLTAASAQADGFVCQTQQGELKIQAFNNTSPYAGTRNAAVLVLSDPNVDYGRKTIARFTDVQDTLTNRGARYFATVDLRFNDSSRKGENILGTKLGMIKFVIVDVDFSYAEPVRDGSDLSGEITLELRNGDVISEELDCVRYLKDGE